MSEPSPPTVSHEPRGLEFLELLESRHNHVLDELELLNERIQTVLSLHSEKRTNEG